MKIKLLSLFPLFLLLQGCSSPTPKAPTLEPAVDFEKGVSLIPEDQYLFLEFRSTSVCSTECNCAPEAPSAPLYEITPAGELWIERDLGISPSGDPWLTTDSQGRQSLSGPIMGFFVYNAWGGRVSVMNVLPFTLTPGDTPIATVYSVAADGTAVVEIYGETYFIKPGQAWADSGEYPQEPPAGCYISYSNSISNLGLFKKTQVQFGFPSQ